MTGYGKRGKPKTGFPLFPQPLEIAVRFPHSHRPGGERRWKSGNPKAGFPLSHCTVFPYQIHSERRPSCGSLRSRLQAHRSMRKCYCSCLKPMIPGRILALDLGKRRIGLALSDELGITAQGLETLQRTTIREDIARLAQLTMERNV